MIVVDGQKFIKHELASFWDLDVRVCSGKDKTNSQIQSCDSVAFVK